MLLQYAAVLQGGTFEEARMPQNIEACDWLASALRSLDAPFLDANYANMRAVSFYSFELILNLLLGFNNLFTLFLKLGFLDLK